MLGFISTDVTTLNPDLVNCRNSCLQITSVPGSFCSGSRGGSFLEERAACNRADETPSCCIFTACCLLQCGWAMSGIVKVIVSFFRKGEEVARHRTIEAGFRWTRKLIKEYLSQKTSYEVFRTKGALQAHQYGIGGFSLK